MLPVQNLAPITNNTIEQTNTSLSLKKNTFLSEKKTLNTNWRFAMNKRVIMANCVFGLSLQYH